MRDHSTKEEAVKHMLLIPHGDAPTPYAAEDWPRLSEAERKEVAGDYQAITRVPATRMGGAVEVRPIAEW
jgi:hypothetical protein